MPKMTPRILIKSDGTIAGTTITTDQGADISRYITGITWHLNAQTGGIANASLDVFLVGNEAELEVTEALTSRLHARRPGFLQRLKEVTRLGHKERMYVKA